MARVLLLTVACLLLLSAAATENHPPALEAAAQPAPVLFDDAAPAPITPTSPILGALARPLLSLRI